MVEDDQRAAGPDPGIRRVCIIGASGKLGRYMVRHCRDRGYEVIGVCREHSVDKLAEFEGRITVVPGATNDREVIRRAVAGCDGVLTVLVPFGVDHYATGTAQAALDFADPGARIVFSCGWHITRDGQDVYRWQQRASATVVGWLARLVRFVDVDDQVEACRRVFASDTLRRPLLARNESRRKPLCPVPYMPNSRCATARRLPSRVGDLSRGSRPTGDGSARLDLLHRSRQSRLPTVGKRSWPHAS